MIRPAHLCFLVRHVICRSHVAAPFSILNRPSRPVSARVGPSARERLCRWDHVRYMKSAWVISDAGVLTISPPEKERISSSHLIPCDSMCYQLLHLIALDMPHTVVKRPDYLRKTCLGMSMDMSVHIRIH